MSQGDKFMILNSQFLTLQNKRLLLKNVSLNISYCLVKMLVLFCMAPATDDAECMQRVMQPPCNARCIPTAPSEHGRILPFAAL